jgi:hypothetical protein
MQSAPQRSWHDGSIRTPCGYFCLFCVQEAALSEAEGMGFHGNIPLGISRVLLGGSTLHRCATNNLLYSAANPRIRQ